MWTSTADRLALLEAEWRTPSPRPRNFPLIARYHAAVQAEPAYHRLDDQTWTDLNGDDLFALLDGTTSRVGQQCLYHRVRSPLNDEAALQDFDQAARLFAEPAPRGKALLALRRLTSTDAYYLPDILTGDALLALPWTVAAPAMVLLLLATVVGGFWQPALWLLSGGLILLHSVLHFWYRSRIKGVMRPMQQLSSLYRAGRGLTRLQLPLAALHGLAEPLGQLGSIVNKVAFLQTDDLMKSEMTMLPWLVLEYLKMMLLLDFIVYRSCRRQVEQHFGAIRAVYEAVGYVDCAVAVAGFRARHPHCVPQFTAETGLRLSGAYNPLVPGCVPNDLTVADTSILLTGSNMSGKTTFMRAIGLSMLLAQTIATCPATAYAAPFRRVVSSINLADSLTEGKSYYFAEAETILGFVRAAEASAGGYLFILDELFKGTNTVERIAATQAVLAYLQPRSLVVASTHDGELGQLLAPAFTEYHFSETVTETDWYFDYLLKPGPLRTRNAIRLLARVGFPTSIVEDAEALSRTLDAVGTSAANP
ncbi:MutS domain V [Hymenobacter arizonensis]|uniref:MutS domain V n=2 Tax=Hymenobacter arizonensis TaxID=1227077 RepID=A0A1I5ZA66_HYMAR|nr:MutS domain V [Hymenobacter arizonensis]